MAGGIDRRDDALVLSSTNVFAALGSLRKKKKKKKKKKSDEEASKEAQEQVFWAPAPLNAKSWADDDDYYTTTAPPESAWSRTDEPKAEGSESEASPEKEKSRREIQTKRELHEKIALRESESDDGLVEVGDVGAEEIENEPEVAVDREPVTEMPIEAPPASKETERQLSKKELKKKGLEELEAVLAEFGYMNREKSSQDARQDDAQVQKPVESNGEVDQKENAPGESKTMKKKKKKDKSLKKAKEVQEQLGGTEVGARTDEATETENFEDSSTIDMKERLKKLTSSKKKKSSKEMDSAARAAAVEAAARSAKLALAKKKEKNCYNQHPAR